MQAIRITTPRHNTSGKLVYDQNLIILNNIILITEHQVMCTKGKDDSMLDLKVLCISQVLDFEETLNLFNAFQRQINNFVLLVYDKVSVFFHLYAHDSIHFGEFSIAAASLHLAGKNITCLI